MDKKLERFYLEEFIKCINITPTSIKDSESPDFLLQINNEIIGIELTSIKQDYLSPTVGNQRKIVRNACSKAINSAIEPLDVHVWFHDFKPNNVQLFIKTASDYLYSIIKNNIDEIKNANGLLCDIDCSDNKYGIFQVTAHWHSVNNEKWLYNHRWKTEEPGFVSINFHDIIQKEIDKKNTKFSRYISKCNKCWLLIVIDRSKKDEHFDYSYMNDDSNYNSNFFNNYIFDLYEKKVYLLKK